jgi:hypothetical protein
VRGVTGVVVLTTVLAACGSSSQDLEILDIVAMPPSTKVAAGKEIPLRVEIRNPRNLPLELEWSPKRGKVFCTSKSDVVCVYQAPREEGTDIIRVVVTSARVTKSKEISLAIDPLIATSTTAVSGGARSLLAGRVEPYGSSPHRCPPSVDGPLAMEVEGRGGNFAMCCVSQHPPVTVRAGDELFAEVTLAQREPELHVKVESDDFPDHIFLHRRDLDRGTWPLRLPLDRRRDLGGRDAVRLMRFCVAAVGAGPLQTIRVDRALVRPARSER